MSVLGVTVSCFISFSANAVFVEFRVWSEERCISVWYEPCDLAEKPNERSCSDQKGNGGKQNDTCKTFLLKHLTNFPNRYAIFKSV